jgi:hypothetical protein
MLQGQKPRDHGIEAKSKLWMFSGESWAIGILMRSRSVNVAAANEA